MKVLSPKNRLFDDVSQRRHSYRCGLQWFFTAARQQVFFTGICYPAGESLGIFQVTHVARHLGHASAAAPPEWAQLFKTRDFNWVPFIIRSPPARFGEQLVVSYF